MRIYTALRLVKIKVFFGLHRNEGICRLVGEYCTNRKQTQELIRKMAAWSDGTGGRMFPVPVSRNNRDIDAAIDAFTHIHKWSKKTEYGQLRRELLNYLIKEFKNSDL